MVGWIGVDDVSIGGSECFSFPQDMFMYLALAMFNLGDGWVLSDALYCHVI